MQQGNEWDGARLLPWLQLSLCEGIGPLRGARLLAQFGTPQAVLQQPLPLLQQALGSAALAQRLLQPDEAELQAALARLQQWLGQADADLGLAHAVWTLDDPRYPWALRQLDDPPLLLYAVGPRAWLDPQAPTPWWRRCRPMLAVVGSRQPTAQGAQNARQFAQQLQELGVCIVSGLARGIDAAAHEGALLAQQDAEPGARLATIAVMGTGADRIYPAAHRALARRIAQQGLLLSEQPLGMLPLATNFPRRNRIITGLSQAVLVVEAAEKSGSLISARLAAEQGRDVLAIPGSIHSPQSRGCHGLIKQGAKLVDCVADVLEELAGPTAPNAAPDAASTAATNADAVAAQAVARGAGRGSKGQGDGAPPQEDAPVQALAADGAAPAAPPAQPKPHGQLGPQQALLEAMGFDPVSLEQLEARTGLPTAQLQALLLELELAQAVARMPGGWFQRLGLA
ncbi:DNA-protecting protein DprA [Vandammella animalimorsus]|uniref:DNA-protecting protein DprA n=1 Tax=Vandammella animalimorsus TaxID=2029117 RepID=A0A2A2ARE5_9BURK|nr:DNA-processing protein DprA [Vandammella animalimorsus]PAT41165.1 DNA-protecting protein DprA [Vandammella animalimorsus]